MPRKRKRTPKKQPPLSSPNKSTGVEELIPHPSSLGWISKLKLDAAASRILNENRKRPYYLSILWPRGSGVEPQVDYLPCGYFLSNDRVYYSFCLQEHRDAQFIKWRDLYSARKETRHSAIIASNDR